MFILGNFYFLFRFGRFTENSTTAYWESTRQTSGGGTVA
jgi:hypothetical protein